MSIYNLCTYKKRTGGRNNLGRITAYHRGGGSRRHMRRVDSYRNLYANLVVVLSSETDPRRSGLIGAVAYPSGVVSYILLPEGCTPGQVLNANPDKEVALGDVRMLKDFRIGTVLHNVEVKPGHGGQLSRSAGSSCLLVGKLHSGYVRLRLPSGEHRDTSSLCRASVGQVSNREHHTMYRSKAGQSRMVGKRPSVRGVAMNPVDHPHGGGEGRTSGGRPSVSRGGIYTKGVRTRRRSSTNRYIVSVNYKK